ncbi:hypothetical protein, partial [Escherichia coli]
KLIMLPSETMIWQPEFTDKTLSRKPGAVHNRQQYHHSQNTSHDIHSYYLFMSYWATAFCPSEIAGPASCDTDPACYQHLMGFDVAAHALFD